MEKVSFDRSGVEQTWIDA